MENIVTNLKQNEAQSARAKSAHKGVNWRLKDVTQAQQQKYESSHVPLVKLMYLVFIRTPGENYRRRFRSLLLCLCDVF